MPPQPQQQTIENSIIANIAKYVGHLFLLIVLWMGQQMLGKIDRLAAGLVVQNQQLERLANDLNNKTQYQWNAIDQRVWATQLALKNPKIIVPEPIHVDPIAAHPVTNKTN